MKIHIKNMVCQGTRFFIINELEKLGLKYNTFQYGELDLVGDLSVSEIRGLDHSLRKYGLEYTMERNQPVSEN